MANITNHPAAINHALAWLAVERDRVDQRFPTETYYATYFRREFEDCDVLFVRQRTFVMLDHDLGDEDPDAQYDISRRTVIRTQTEIPISDQEVVTHFGKGIDLQAWILNRVPR